MDLTKWLELWEKCPELRPHDGPHEEMHIDKRKGACWRSVEYPDSAKRWISDVTAAALIRDRAVLFLAKHRLEFWLRDGLYLARGNTADSQHVVGPWREDPTEVMRLALCKALEAAP